MFILIGFQYFYLLLLLFSYQFFFYLFSGCYRVLIASARLFRFLFPFHLLLLLCCCLGDSFKLGVPLYHSRKKKLCRHDKLVSSFLLFLVNETLRSSSERRKLFFFFLFYFLPMASNFSSTRILNVAQFNLVCQVLDFFYIPPPPLTLVGVAHSPFVGGLINTKQKCEQKMKNNQKIGFFHLDMTTTQRRESQ